MAKKYSLGIRKEDKNIFRALQRGYKTIETRAAKGRFKRIKKGDILIFNCDNETIERKVDQVHFFDSIEKMLEHLPLEDIMPTASNLKEAREIYYSFPDYEKKIKKYGLAAYKLK